MTRLAGIIKRTESDNAEMRKMDDAITDVFACYGFFDGNVPVAVDPDYQPLVIQLFDAVKRLRMVSYRPMDPG